MTGLRFPEELRIGSTSPPPEAAGDRAHVVRRDGSFAATIDGLHAVIRVFAPARPGGDATVACWPFGVECRASDSPAWAVRMFAAPAHPLVVIEWQVGEAAEIRLDAHLDHGLRMRIEPSARTEGDASLVTVAAGETVRIVVTAGSEVLADANAIIAAAFARARSRAARRPSLVTAGVDVPATELAGSRLRPKRPEYDRVALLEHAIRLSLARPATEPAATSHHPTAPRPREDAESRTLVALALLGLNDRELARERLLEEQDPVRVALIAGAWAAWTGDAEALGDSRLRLTDWLRGELSTGAGRAVDAGAPDGAEAGAWRRAARALAPALVEVLGDARASALLRSRAAPPPDEALRSLAELSAPTGGETARAAAAALELLHGTLGIAPDAPRGRLRLAPRIEHAALHLARLTVGDATFTLEASLLGAKRASLRVEQTSGASPNTVILEPWLRARALLRAWVDGAPAQLDATPDGGGLRPRVQLITDHDREVLLEFE